MEITRLFADGYSAAAMDNSASAFWGCGNIYAFACGFSRESYLEGGPSSQDYLNDIQCLEAWIACLLKVQTVICRGPINLDMRPLRMKMLPAAEGALRYRTFQAL